MIYVSVAPLGRFNRSRILAALLPSRANVVFFAALAFGADLPFLAATCARFGATRAFLPGFGFSGPVSSVFNVVILVSPWRLLPRSRHESLCGGANASEF